MSEKLNAKTVPSIWDRVADNYKLEISSENEDLGREILSILKKIGIEPGSKIIELGCGSGHLSAILAQNGYDTTLLDFSDKALEKAKAFYDKNNLRGRFIKEDILRCNTIGEKYDLVWNSGVMEHFDDNTLIKALLSIREISKKYFVFIVPNYKSMPYILYRYKMLSEDNWIYGTEYLRDNYEKFLKEAGFNTIYKYYLGGSFSRHQLNYLLSDDSISKYVTLLIDLGIIPEEEKYLTAYITSVEDKTESEIKDIISSELNVRKISNVEDRTLIFDLIGKLNGVEIRLRESNKEKTILINNINKLETELDNYKVCLSESKDLLLKVQKENETYLNTIKCLEEQINITNQHVLEKQVEFQGTVGNYEIETNNLEEQLLALKYEIDRYKIREDAIRKKVLELSLLKPYRLAHFLRRFKFQFLKGDVKKKVSFIKWFISKCFMIRKNYGNEYNALYEILALMDKPVETNILNKELVITNTEEKQLKQVFREELRRIVEKNKGKKIIIFCPIIDWNIPLFQRPQHIAINLANQGYLYFFCVLNHYDNVSGFKKIESNGELYLTDQFDLLLEELNDNVIFHIYAQDANIDSSFIDKQLARGAVILYEYIDELSEDLCTAKENVIDRHIKVLKNEDIYVVATASKLIEEIKKYRNKNYKLVTNGVDYSHFTNLDMSYIPDDIKNVVQKRKPIIGYFGALAKWFDYNLIEKLAKERQEYEILLIGWDYDGSLKKSKLNKMENVTIIGPIDYKILPQYAKFFDVSIISFLINDITEATSPVKLFEYMALGHPIVTTDMPECRKYESVLIGKTHDEFIEKVDLALKLKDNKEYKDLLKKEALENTWQSKAKNIDILLKNEM